MMVQEILQQIREKVSADEQFRNRFLESRKDGRPLHAFCSLCREMGYEIYPMDVIDAGEEAYAAMKRSTNGGGENSPELADWGNDVYEEFFKGL